MFKRHTLKLAAALFAASALVTTAHAERLSISTWGSPKHPQVSQFIPQFEKKLEEKSGGKFRVRSFQGGEMVKQEFVPTAIPQGTVDISLTTMDTWSGRVPEVSILTTPLWNKSMQWTRDNLKPGDPIFDYFDAKFREQGAVVLALFDIGPAVVSTNFPLKTPDDMKGKSVRVYSRGAGQVIQELGGSPVTMGVGDVYSGLQRGTVDGAMGGLGGAVGLKHYEVTDHMLVQNGVIGTLVHGYVMNRDKFERMDPELRKALLEAVAESRDAMQQYLIDIYAKQVDEVRQSGSNVVTIEQNSAEWKVWEDALADFAENARQEYPAGLVKLIAAD
ncbi:TRAP transporter substrate-binding protein [Pseudazoarcus pumilus]|uniref:ABC transporter substrate-binding protein n=1 Tax=Pseudazoarcus pumilus TaxID=2067960 RepID=A0A2I6S8M0_9RHOO|nr:TRAP transporter substrate-binding protein DctP [Pseudazoarcus pumilus]AUN95598.1 ABC transporter substrate-binding protein [Pseudazoarcus pumilus]